MQNSKLILMVASATMVLAQSAWAATAGYVQFVNGQATLVPASGSIRALQKGATIEEGDTVRTAANASVQIKMKDGGFIAVRPDTQLKFDSFKFSGRVGEPERSVYSLFKGGFRAITGLIGRVNKQDYRINTPVATIGIRGTDHETLYLPSGLPGAQAGAYSKVNIGETTLTTRLGTINVLPNQMGFAGGMDQMPQIRPVNTAIFTVAAAPREERIAAKDKAGQGEASQTHAGNAPQERADGDERGAAPQADAGNAPQESAQQTVRNTAVVDNTTPAAAVQAAVAPAPAAVIRAVSLAPGIEQTIPVTASNGALSLNASAQTISSGTTVTSVQNGIYATQADAAALAAAQAAQNAAAAAAAAASAKAVLLAISLVSTAPAVTAINNATTAIGTTTTGATLAVANATALQPANAVAAAANKTTAQTAATTAGSQATAAQAAITAHGAFADVTAPTANTALQTANTALQTANTGVQTNAAAVTSQNTALGNAQTAANSALAAANGSLTTANNNVGAVAAQNTAITSAQTNAATLANNAQAAANLAAAAAQAAQTAATQAAALQSAGDLTGAAAQLAIAQQEQAKAGQQLAIAQSASTALVNLLATAQTANNTAATLVNAAVTAAGNASTAAASAQTAAGNATTAAGAAATALANTSAPLAGINTNAATVAANAPIAAYNNPAVVSNNFLGHFAMPVPRTGGGFDMAQEYSNTQLAHTTYVLDGNGNLVEMRSTAFAIQPLLTTPTLSIGNVDMTWSGGTAADTFKLADNSIYFGRWVNPTITVKDPISNLTLYTYTPASSLWGVLLTPNVGYVQSLIGTTTYVQAGAVAPFDTAGHVGTLNSATLVADFTSQLVNAALNLTMPVASSMAGTYAITANGMAINTVATGQGYGGFGGNITPTVSCTGTTGTCAAGAAGYSADVGGTFTGNAAASVVVGYNLWPTVTPGSPVTDLVQGVVAFTATTAPTGPTFPPAGNWFAGGHMLVGTTNAWERGRFNNGGLLFPETNFILDGSGNLVRSLHANYNERSLQTATSLPANQFTDALVSYSGGVASDRYITPDNNLIIGRWTGGQMTIADNLRVLPTLVKNLGATSSYWFMTAAVPTDYVPQLVGTTTYTQGGATLPTDSLGNVGTLPVSSLSVNFTAQTVNASVAFTIANKNMNIANGAIPIVAGTESFEGSLELNTAPTVTCGNVVAGACNAGGYLGWLTGGLAGAQATSAELAYKIWPTAPADSLVTDLIQGVVAFYTGTAPTPGPDKAYNPNHIAVEIGNGFSGLASPADLVYVTGAAGGAAASGALQSMTFRDLGGGAAYTSTHSTTGGTATSANSPAFATTGIQYGQWTGYTGLSFNDSMTLGGRGGPGVLDWMFGPQGYVDAAYMPVAPATALSGTMAATFTYQMDGATAPYSHLTGLRGTLSIATLTANFATMLAGVNLALTMPGNDNWAVSAANVPINFAVGNGAAFYGFANPGNPANTMTISHSVGAAVPLTACGTCDGNLNGAFTGQNFQGAMLSYILHNNANGGTDASGHVALTSQFAGNTNPVVAKGVAAPTGNILVADYGGNIAPYPALSTTTTGNVLTAYGQSSGTPPNTFSYTTTVTCPTCTSTAAGQVASSGIYYGNWTAGSWLQSYTSTLAAGVMPPAYWITGPEAGPLYLPQALTGTASYTFNGGQVSNNAGVAGTILGTTALTLDFNRQAVGINLAVSVNSVAPTPAAHTWAVSTPAGGEAVLGMGQGIGSAAFHASSFGGGGGSGLLNVTVDGGATAVANANANISGQLTGAGLNGAIMSFQLGGQISPAAASPSFENINGVAAFTGPAQNTATSHRYVAVSFYDPFRPVPQPELGFGANNTTRVTQDVAGNLTQFDTQFIQNNGGSSLTFANNTSTLTDHGSDATTGISWGRWAGGTMNATDRLSSVVTPVTQPGSLHWIAEPAATSATTLPVVGTYTYVNAGGTTPTDNLGNLGTLNSATLTADFTARTVNMGVNVTVAGATLNAVGNNVPIIQRTVFYASSQEPAGTTSHLNVSCAGTCGATLGGTVVGKFSGAGAIGAVMAYGLQNGSNVVSGVTAFHR